VFNLGESETIELRDLIRLIEDVLGKKAHVERLPEQPGDMPVTFANVTKARRLLGYRPSTTVKDGLQRFVEWFLTAKRGRP